MRQATVVMTNSDFDSIIWSMYTHYVFSFLKCTGLMIVGLKKGIPIIVYNIIKLRNLGNS